jgi:hypothetical protein
MDENQKQRYEVWKAFILQDLPAEIECPDCEGSGWAECPHCGNTTVCDTCDGHKRVGTAVLLTYELFRRVMSFEEAMLERWKEGIAPHYEIFESVQHNRFNTNPLMQEILYYVHPEHLKAVPKAILRIHA